MFTAGWALNTTNAPFDAALSENKPVSGGNSRTTPWPLDPALEFYTVTASAVGQDQRLLNGKLGHHLGRKNGLMNKASRYHFLNRVYRQLLRSSTSGGHISGRDERLTIATEFKCLSAQNVVLHWATS